jgi:hypothetical protein
MEMSKTGFDAGGQIPVSRPDKEQSWPDYLSTFSLAPSLHCSCSTAVSSKVNARALGKLDAIFPNWNRGDATSLNAVEGSISSLVGLIARGPADDSVLTA